MIIFKTKVSRFDFLPADLISISSEDTFDIFSAICTPALPSNFSFTLPYFGAGSLVPIAELIVPLLTVEDVAGFPFCTSSIRFYFITQNISHFGKTMNFITFIGRLSA